MKISKKGEYALKALTELAISHSKGAKVTLLSDIARQDKIPPKYLEQILLNFKNAGILVSKRGVGGGYALTRSPEGISLGEVIRTVEGPLAPLNCVSRTAYKNCPDEPFCGLYSVMLDVRNAVSSIVDNISLRDIARRTLDLREKKGHALNYVI